VRCLEHFHRTDNKRQALYGIIQGGIYKDLREISAEFVNNHSFFGLAIGGSLGASKREMYEIVEYTRSLLRNDRPVHLLGIGGIRDIFHGVRQGIDTFDCVHPTRLGRHGSALVRASFWDESLPDQEDSAITLTDISQLPKPLQNRCNKLIRRLDDRIVSHQCLLEALETKAAIGNDDKTAIDDDDKADIDLKIAQIRQKIEAAKQEKNSLPEIIKQQYRAKQEKQYQQSFESGPVSVSTGSELKQLPLYRSRSLHGRVREHIHLSKAEMRDDSRPIDATCSCYTCRNFSRGYIHHLIKAGEVLGGTLVTIHNIAFMNRLMRDIRRGIVEDTLDEVEKEYIHPELAKSAGDTLSIGN
jgi:queuine/archaeosine tRNA-ribosyltransferase